VNFLLTSWLLELMLSPDKEDRIVGWGTFIVMLLFTAALIFVLTRCGGR